MSLSLHAQGALDKARQQIVDALRARTKGEVFDVALAAIHATVPGAAAYCAELKTSSDTGQQQGRAQGSRSMVRWCKQSEATAAAAG